MKRITLLLLSLTGCGGISNSGVQPVGPDTYMTSVTRYAAFGGVSEAQRVALNQANSYCAGQGRQMQILQTRSTQDETYRAAFRCLATGDRELQRPTLVRPPDIVVQTR